MALTTGKALMDGADKLADSKVRHALLLPAAIEVGKLWGEDAKSWADQQRAKRLRAQIDRGAKLVGQEGFARASERAEFLDWADGASQADPDDGELSALWQAALLSIADMDPMRIRLLALAKKMSPDEVRHLLSKLGGDKSDEAYYQRKFVGYGLNGSFWDKFTQSNNPLVSLLFPSMVFSIFVIIIATFTVPLFPPILLKSLGINYLKFSDIFLVFFGLDAFAFLTIIFFVAMRQRPLTGFGMYARHSIISASSRLQKVNLPGTSDTEQASKPADPARQPKRQKDRAAEGPTEKTASSE